MVNLIAGRRVVPELMQGAMTGEAIAREARKLLGDEPTRAEMKSGLAEVQRKLAGREPVAAAASIVQEVLEGQVAHVS
jgi:lipid-A-disaccharide synthase